jgi:hypothetical protein
MAAAALPIVDDYEGDYDIDDDFNEDEEEESDCRY